MTLAAAAVRARVLSDSSKKEKLARLEAMEQQRFAAERQSPARNKKNFIEKLRIAFLGKKIVESSNTTAISTSELFVLPAASAEGHPQVSAPPGFTPPKPRPLRVTGDLITLLSAILALGVRLGAGVLVCGWRPRLSFRAPAAGAYSLKLGPLHLSDTSSVLRGELPRPTGRLILYEFDSSPFCRKVRDALTMLDLTAEMRPTPGAGIAPPNVFSDEHLDLHGRRTVPFLLDEGMRVAMFESEEIVKYLYRTYGPGEQNIPGMLRGLIALISSGTSAVIRGMPADKLQVDARTDNHLMRPLTIYGYEGSPFVHPVREKLSALGLPHTVIPCGRGSANRALLAERTGRQFQVPHLIDPNTGVEMSESIEIRMYLDRVYTTSGYTPLRGGSYLSELA